MFVHEAENAGFAATGAEAATDLDGGEVLGELAQEDLSS
jgi:hypothetical protein